MKFQKTIVLTRLLVVKLMHESSLQLHTPHTYQVGQWVRFLGKLGQIELISTSGVDVRFRGENLPKEITIKLIRPENFPSFLLLPPIPPPPAPFSSPLYDLVESINLPLLALGGGVALLLLALIY
jgi:hypothetical protein